MTVVASIPWFQLGRVPIPGLPDEIFIQVFGVLVVIAVIVVVRVANIKAKRDGVDPVVAGEMGAYMLIGGFTVNHFFTAVFYRWDMLVERPLYFFEVWNGMSSIGGFLGAMSGALFWSWRRGIPLVPMVDPIAFAAPFGFFFGRLGCFLAHDHPGHITTFFLGVADYRIPGTEGPWPARHDLGLYEAMWSVAAAGLFLFLARKRRPRGFYLALLPLIYAPFRFGIDFLRATDIPWADTRYFGLTPAHYGVVLLGAWGAWLWVRVQKGPAFVLPEEARWPNPPGGTPDANAAGETQQAPDPAPDPEAPAQGG